MLKPSLFAAAALMLAASPSLAQEPAKMPKDFKSASKPGTVGYFTMPSDDGRTMVVYTGDTRAKPERVAQLAMLRAAQLTLESGKEWFAVISAGNREVDKGDINNLDGRTGGFLSTGGISAGGGGNAAADGSSGGTDASVAGGPSIGGFGGGDVPYQMIERWRPVKYPQTFMIIQMGSGDEAKFPGVTSTPQIFLAKDVVTDMTAKR